MGSIKELTTTEKAYRGLTHNSIRDEEVYGRKLHPDVRSGSYLYYDGKGQPFLFLATMAAVASGADATEHIAVLPGNGGVLHYWPIGAIAAAMKGPTADADGLRLDFDAAAADGVNIVPGGLLGPWRLVIERTAGQDPPDGLFIRVWLKIEDVSGTTDLAIGFRKSEAVQAAIDDYDELACLNVISGDVKRETILNTAATVTVDTGFNWADGETHELLLKCQGNGKVEMFFDRGDTPIGAAFQFDDAEVVVPFLFGLQAADLTEIRLVKLEVGHLSQLE